jgi:AP-3 complex subunit beta
MFCVEFLLNFPFLTRIAYLSFSSSLDSNHLPALIQIITTLLRDRSPLSLGCVAAAFEAVCPTRLDLLHEHYRRLCRILVEVDEWGQVDLINLLLRYARTMLPRPMGTKGSKGVAAGDDGEKEEEIDPDVRLLLNSMEGTFQNRNPAVCVLFYFSVLVRFTHEDIYIYIGGSSRYESDILRCSSILLA